MSNTTMFCVEQFDLAYWLLFGGLPFFAVMAIMLWINLLRNP